jgi:putative flippase GtrA
MKKKEILRTLKYVLFAASAGIIEFGSMTLLELIFGERPDDDPLHWVFYTIALVLSVIWNFTINRRYTFKSASNIKKAMLLVLLFYLVFAPFSIWLEKVMTEKWGWHWIIATIVNMILNLALEFPYQRFIVFRNSIDTNDLAVREKDGSVPEQNETEIEP